MNSEAKMAVAGRFMEITWALGTAEQAVWWNLWFHANDDWVAEFSPEQFRGIVRHTDAVAVNALAKLEEAGLISQIGGEFFLDIPDPMTFKINQNPESCFPQTWDKLLDFESWTRPTHETNPSHG